MRIDIGLRLLESKGVGWLGQIFRYLRVDLEAKAP